jgi:hypothetical protein
MIQIGNDGGLLPQAAPLKNTPVVLEEQTPSAADQAMGEFPSVVAITGKTLYLAPGERADVIVDFSQVPAGSKLILYNDAPAPAPTGDTRVDYYTGDVDQTAIGGAPPTLAGYGPNTRTVLQFQVDGPAAAPFDLGRLERALPAAYAAAQDPVLVPSAEYDAVYGTTTSPDAPQATASPDAAQPDDGMQDIAMQDDAMQDDGMPQGAPSALPGDDAGTLTFTPLGRGYRLTLPVQGKIVADLFDPTYGRKTATLGVDAPLSATGVRTGVPYSAIDPTTEYLAVEREATAPQLGDATQLWRISHDGTQSHSIAFGGFDVQVVERARRDGAARPPDPGELGWKDTVRIDPLESVLIAARPVLPAVPFRLPASERDLDVTREPGAKGGFTELDPVTAAPLPQEVVNAPADLSFEACWSIHLIGGEESHTARPLVLQGTTVAPAGLTATAAGGPSVELAWTPPLFPPPVTGYVVERAADEDFTDAVAFTAEAGASSYTDATAEGGRTYFYRVRTEAAAGWSAWSGAAEVSVP